MIRLRFRWSLSRDAHELFQVPRAIQAGRVWVNQYNTYPAHAL
jgi:aldehyde dehydrogenase (NAD+)/aldehyde dehydrogenase